MDKFRKTFDVFTAMSTKNTAFFTFTTLLEIDGQSFQMLAYLLPFSSG